MALLQYIIPQELFLKIVILVMIVLAIFVAHKCIQLWKLSRENLAMLVKMEDVTVLKKALLDDKADKEKVFADYEKELGKSAETYALFGHLKTIYDAGTKSSRLDAALLVENTVGKIFMGVGSLKTSISLFLVIGILGTLAGLAISIGGFNGANFVMTGQATSTANELSALFGNLRGAFAPSMWGVTFTIIFVFCYAWFIQNDCINKVTEKLTFNTIQYWLPYLYPSDFQRGEISRIKLQSTIKNANNINKGTTELENKLKSTNKTLQELAHVAQLVTSASQKFDKSTDKITQIQKSYDDLQGAITNFNTSVQQIFKSAIQDRKDAYQKYVELADEKYGAVELQGKQLQEQFKQLQTDLRAKRDAETAQFSKQMNTLADQVKNYFEHLSVVMRGQNDNFTKGMATQYNSWQSLLHNQGQQLSEVINHLQSYDDNFFKTVNESKGQLDQSIAVNQQIAKNIAGLDSQLKTIEERLLNRQDEVIKALQEPIVQQLGQISTALAAINNPLNKAVKNTQTMLDHNVKSLTALVEPLRETMEKLKVDQEELGKNRSDMQAVLTNVQQTLDKMNQNLTVMIATAGKEQGLDQETLNTFIQAAVSKSSVQPAEVHVPTEPVADIRNGFLAVKNIPIIAIAVLLLISVVTQVVMVTKISTLEQNQAAVNRVLMKGEMNGTAGTNP